MIKEMKEEILLTFVDEYACLTDDLLERYSSDSDFGEEPDYEEGNIEELIAIWIADLLTFELIMGELGVDMNFDKAYQLGIHYLKYFYPNLEG